MSITCLSGRPALLRRCCAVTAATFLSLAACLACSPAPASGPPLTSADSGPRATVPVTLWAPDPTTTPTPAPTPTATPIPPDRVRVDPGLPAGIRQPILDRLAGLAQQRQPGQPALVVAEDLPAGVLIGAPAGVGAAAPATTTTILTRTYAVVAPFPTVPDSITLASLMALWQGGAVTLPAPWPAGVTPTLFLDADTRDSLKVLLGQPSPAAPIQVVDSAGLVDAAWAARPAALAILPFDQLEPRWKLLWLDGMNLFDRTLDEARYPLTLRVTVAGDPALAAALPISTNRDPSRLAIVAMTGVTALVRGTAVQMERKGITYPGEKIRDWLATADVTHISNEVSFWDECPPPTFNDGVSMCSNPKYIELLKYVGTDIIDLSGNHLWDKGWQHLSTTLQLYDDLGWPYFAGGRTAADALKPVTMTANGNRIAFVGCNWFGADWATDAIPGSARCGADDPRALDLIIPAIQSLKEQGYLVIAAIQYEEYYFYEPTARQAQDFKALRDAGAVVVNGSQGHHAQGFDVNAAGFIHYGTGNLFFGDQEAVGAHQTFVDRHAFYGGRYLGVDLRTAFIEDYSQPVPMSPEARATFLTTIYNASGY